MAATPEHDMVDNAARRAIPPDAVEAIWTAPDGHAIRRIDWPARHSNPRGAILFLPGRADFYEKYIETLDGWASQGWRVTALDWRWQAGSGRYYADPRIGGADDFGTWTSDLAQFWSDWASPTSGPHVLAGHSMGGHLALRAVADRQIAPTALVLSAPMLGFITPIPDALQATFGWLMCRIGDPARAAWGEGEKPGDTIATRGAALTHDTARYADELWWRRARPALDLGPASWDWVRKASESMRHLASPGVLEAVTVPTLVLAAPHDALVAWPAIQRAVGRMSGASLVDFGADAAHELLREADPVRDAVLAAIDRFLMQVCADA